MKPLLTCITLSSLLIPTNLLAIVSTRVLHPNKSKPNSQKHSQKPSKTPYNSKAKLSSRLRWHNNQKQLELGGTTDQKGEQELRLATSNSSVKGSLIWQYSRLYLRGGVRWVIKLSPRVREYSCYA